MISVWTIRAGLVRAAAVGTVTRTARLARIAGKDVDLESWVRAQAAGMPDMHRRALMLAACAQSLAKEGRVAGAVRLLREGLLAAHAAGSETVLSVILNGAAVLTAAGLRDDLVAVADTIRELRAWTVDRG